MIKGMILILVLLIFRSLMAMSLNVPLMVYIYINKGDDFNFGIVNFPFLDGDVPQCPSYGVYIYRHIYRHIYISQLIRCQSIFACY